MNLFLLVAFAGNTFMNAGSLPTKSDVNVKKCRYNRAYSMLQVTCQDMKLKEIPRNLQSNIQVLDVRDNKIRELQNDTLSRYTSLVQLYLQDNVIQEIDESSFESMNNLQVLDLSTNGIRDVPKSLFELPKLKILYLSQNILYDSSVMHADVKSPLVFLRIARNKLTKIPRLHPLPFLTKLDLANNRINHISPEEIAHLCSLKILDVTGNNLRFDKFTCSCHEFRAWTDLRQIVIRPNLKCRPELDVACAHIEFTNRTANLFKNCSGVLAIKPKVKKEAFAWSWAWMIWIVPGGFIFVVCFFIICLVRIKKKKRRNLKNVRDAALSSSVFIKEGAMQEEVVKERNSTADSPTAKEPSFL